MSDIPDRAAPPPGPGSQALPIGTRLAEFEIRGFVNQGGFGIVYEAHDHSLDRTVALKEYMPSALAQRVGEQTVAATSPRNAEAFEAGLRSFVNEARLLARFDHPSLVKVYRFWEGNGTAYMAMKLYRGPTLKEALRRAGAPPDEAWLRRLLAPLLDALALLHAEPCWHRDIAPDNILLQDDGPPVLLDFGAARRVIGDLTQALSVVLKPGYAPIEQYAESESLRQGPWTDIYALAAVLYFAITGTTPVPSVARMDSDPLEALARRARGRYGEAFLQAIDRGLAVRPGERPQSVAEFAGMLGIALSAPTDRDEGRTLSLPGAGGPGAAGAATAGGSGVGAGGSGAGAGAHGVRAGGAGADGVGAGASGAGATGAGTPRASGSPSPAAGSATAGAGARRTGLVAALAAFGLAAVATLGWWILREPAGEPPVRPGVFDPVTAIDEVFSARDPAIAVDVAVQHPRATIGQDPIRFTLQAARPGFVYLLLVDANRTHLSLLFPNALDQDNRIVPGVAVTLPRESWELVAEGPPGTSQFVAIVSQTPRDFGPAGATPAEGVAEFPLSATAERWSAHRGPQPLLAGRPVCPAPPAECSPAYGAARFAIEEVEPAAPATAPDSAAPPTRGSGAQPKADVGTGSTPQAGNRSTREVCRDLLQRASAGEALTPQEVARMNRDCR